MDLILTHKDFKPQNYEAEHSVFYSPRVSVQHVLQPETGED